MRFARVLAVALCSLVLASGAFAQGKAAPAAAKDDVLSLIPAGSMGAIVVSNVKATTDKVDQFMAELGLPPFGVLNMMLSAAQLEDGFRADGGFAVVMLDPQQFGFDFAQMMQGGMDDDEDGENLPPFAMYLPGKSVKDLFANYEVGKAKAGIKHQQVTLPNGFPVYATEMKGYVVVSPSAKVLDAIVASKKAITTTMTKEQAAAVADNDLALYADMKICGPLFVKLMDFQQQMMTQGVDEDNPGAMFAMKFMMLAQQQQREMLEQMDSMLLGVKFVKEGLVMEQWSAFTKGSDFAKLIGEVKPLGKEMLNKLPAANYILAVDAVCSSGPQTDKARELFLSALLGDDSLDMLSEADKTKLMGIIETLSTQVTRGQFVVGGSAGEGAIATAAVLTVKDTTKFTTALKDTVKLVNKLVKDAMVAELGEKGAAEAGEIGLVYKAAASKSGAVSVDEISASLPEEVLDGSEEVLTQIIGDSQVRFLVACPDKTTVVITLGGSDKQMAEALKTATKGGGVDLAKAKVNGLKYMPENRYAVGAFNVANLLKVIAQAADNEGIPQLQTDAPLTFAAAAVNNQQRVAFFVPTATIQEVTQLVMGMMGGGFHGGHGGDDDDDDEPMPYIMGEDDEDDE